MSSWILQLASVFSGTQMSIAPSLVVLNSHTAQELIMSCSLMEAEMLDARILNLAFLQIGRTSLRDSGTVVITSMEAGGQPQLGNVEDIRRRNPSVSGIMDTANSQVPKHKAELVLRWNTAQIECEDDGEYECLVFYTDAATLQVGTLTGSSTLTVETYPADLKLKLIRNGVPVSISEGTGNDPVQFEKGDEVDMSCSASIGTNNSYAIEWYRTRERSPTDDIGKYNPKYSDVFDEGTVSDIMRNCTYSRTSTLRYVITEEDTKRKEPFVFLCRIHYVSEGESRVLESDRRIYIRVDSSKLALIIGVVVAVLLFIIILLVMLLVYCLCCRRRIRTKANLSERRAPERVTETSFKAADEGKGHYGYITFPTKHGKVQASSAKLEDKDQTNQAFASDEYELPVHNYAANSQAARDGYITPVPNTDHDKDSELYAEIDGTAIANRSSRTHGSEAEHLYQRSSSISE